MSPVDLVWYHSTTSLIRRLSIRSILILSFQLNSTTHILQPTVIANFVLAGACHILKLVLWDVTPCTRTDILEDWAASSGIHPDNGGNMIHWYVGTSVPEYTASRPERQRYAEAVPLELQVLFAIFHSHNSPRSYSADCKTCITFV